MIRGKAVKNVKAGKVLKVIPCIYCYHVEYMDGTREEIRKKDTRGEDDKVVDEEFEQLRCLSRAFKKTQADKMEE